jgi:hypothetical protein
VAAVETEAAFKKPRRLIPFVWFPLDRSIYFPFLSPSHTTYQFCNEGMGEGRSPRSPQSRPSRGNLDHRRWFV